MASKKKAPTRKYCRIHQWVSDQDPKFANAIRELCLEGALSGGRSGVTFLYPKDEAYRAEIVEKAFSMDADKAVEMVNSLIIPMYLASGKDFSEQDIGSRGGVKFDVKSADSGKVKLDGDVELTLSDDFVPLDNRQGSLAVWIVSKGRPPLTGAPFKAGAGRPKKTEGGAERKYHGGREELARGDRALLATAVEAAYGQSVLARTPNPYLCKSVSLLNYLRLSRPELYGAVLPLIDYEPIVTFYILLEPYKRTGEYILPNDVLFGEGGWGGAEIYSDAVREYEAHFAAAPGAAGADASAVPAIYRDRAAVAAQVDQLRAQFARGSKPRDAPKIVCEMYATLAAQNSIAGLGPILPAATLRIISGAKKLWQDELRFHLHYTLRELRAAPFSASEFNSEVVQTLRNMRPGNNYDRETSLTNPGDLQWNTSPSMELLLLNKFVNSTDFLYFAVPPSLVGDWGGDPCDPTDAEVFNCNKEALAQLRRSVGSSRPAGISGGAMAELNHYFEQHGQIPAGVAALCDRVGSAAAAAAAAAAVAATAPK
jgi:hypothetical protein